MPLPDVTPTLYMHNPGVLQDTLGAMVPSATGYVYASAEVAATGDVMRALPLWDVNGVQRVSNQLVTSLQGFVPRFMAALPVVYVNFSGAGGGTVQEVVSGRTLAESAASAEVERAALLATVDDVGQRLGILAASVPGGFLGAMPKTTSFLVTSEEMGYVVRVNSATTVTATVPADAETTVAVGARTRLLQVGAGAIVVAGGANVALRATTLPSLPSTSRPWQALDLVKVGASEWVVSSA